MADEVNPDQTPPADDIAVTIEEPVAHSSKTKNKNKEKDSAASKRRCVSTACIACRKRKSKCDGNLPKCAACASVYLTECEYAPHTDHRRKGVYKKEVDSSKAKNSTLQTLIQAILNAEEDDVMELVRRIRTCDSLEELAHRIETEEKIAAEEVPDSPVYKDDPSVPQFEAELSGKMGDLMLDGSVKFIGGTSNLIWLPEDYDPQRTSGQSPGQQLGTSIVRPREEAVLSWTTVTEDKELILHFINMYFCWHYAFFTTLAKQLFYRDFLTGTSSQYCSPLLVNVMLALGCHFSSRPAARADPDNSGTTGDHFFAEAKRLLYEDDEFANAKLCTVHALALMSVREAGCGRESKGWVYSGMSFRMACDLGLNVDVSPINESSRLADEDIDARRITFWGCFLFDKCWSNYLGRQPQLLMPNITVKKPEVFPHEDSEMWSPYTDSGIIQAHAQPARTRAVALQLSKLAEISGDLLASFYNPTQIDKPISSKAELKKLSDVHTRLEAWKQALPSELEAREGQLPQVLLMHMFFQLLYIHLYRPFLKYTRSTSPLPSHISPRKFCTQAAGAVSKLFRLYKRTHGLRQICNIAIYIIHSACTIHLLNLPDKNARRDIIHGVKHLEEMGECWTAARRTLTILQVCAEKWKINIPDEADVVLTRVRMKWGLGVDGSTGTGGALANYSPQSQNLAQMAKQITSQPLQLTDLMARNIQQQQQALMRSSIPQVHPGLSGGHMAPSPAETIDTRRSSGGLSLPPTTAADLSRNLHKVRPSTHLTQAQQDAWNSHQARMKGAVASASAAAAAGSGAGAGQPLEAARLFGGVDSLMEETQDWFFKDQNQLAAGFENWGGPTQQDWGTLDLSFFDDNGPAAHSVQRGGQGGGINGGAPGGGGTGSGVATNENSPDYMGNGIDAGYDNGYEPYLDTNPVDVNGYTAQFNGGGGGIGGNSGYSSEQNGASGSAMGAGMGTMGSSGGGGRAVGGGSTYGYKRHHLQASSRDRPFDDDMYY